MVKVFHPTQADYKKVYDLSAIGLTVAQIGAYLGLAKRTFESEMERNPELQNAIENGRANAIANVSSKLWKLIEDGHPAAIFFYLKCRGGWRETVNFKDKSDGGFKFKKSKAPDG